MYLLHLTGIFLCLIKILDEPMLFCFYCRMNVVIRYKNCRVLRNGELHQDDLWVRSGRILDPMVLFFRESVVPDITIDCKGMIASLGFIHLQVNSNFCGN